MKLHLINSEELPLNQRNKLLHKESEMLKESLSLPMVHPSGGSLALLCVGAVLLPMLSGLVTSLISAFLVTKNETGLLLREDG